MKLFAEISRTHFFRGIEP